MIQGFLLGILGIIVGVVAVGFFQIYPPIAGVGTSFFSTETCNIATSTKALIGPGNSREIAATTSRRSWITITSTTTPVYLGLEGRKAIIGNGLAMITEGTNSTSTLSFDEQRAYTGAISGRTLGASTSVMVTECSY